MHPLARTHHAPLLGLVHEHDIVDKDARCVDHRTGTHVVALPRFLVDDRHTAHLPIIVVQQSDDLGMVHYCAAMVDHRLCQVHRHAGVVKLPVVINHAALQPLFLNCGQVLLNRFWPNEARTPVAEPKRQHVVEREPAKVEEIFPMRVVGDDKRLVLHQMRSVALHETTLPERLEHKLHIAVLQVAHTAMHELCATARCGLGKVILLQQRHTVAPGSSIDSASQPRGSAAHNYHIPYLAVLAYRLDLFTAFHKFNTFF